MLPQFEWSVPTKVTFGNGTINKAGSIVKDLGKRCFLVTGRHSAEKNGSLKKLTDQFSAQGITFTHFNKISSNPKTTEIDEAAALIRAGKYDLVLALGGGSVMDASKAIAMLAKNEGQIWDYVYKGPGKKFKRFNTALPIVMIPTLAATGSELNSGAVISNPLTKEKTPLFGDTLYPTLTIIDPQLTWTVPYASTVDGAVDIICHVLEMYLSSNADDYLQDQLAIAITKTVRRCLDILKNDLQNSEARAQMFWASSLALSGVATEGRSGSFPMHAIEHALSGHSDTLAHGRGLATILIETLKYDGNSIPAKIIGLSANVFERHVLSVPEAIQLWKEWLHFHGTGDSLKEYIGSIPPETLADQIICFSGTPDLLHNVRPFYKEDLRTFIKGLSAV